MAGKYSINNLTVFWQPTPVSLPGESISRTEEPGGLQPMGLHSPTPQSD